jgi:outer membrane protein
MRKLLGLFLCALLASVSLSAKESNKYSFRVAYGYGSEKDLGDILFTLDFSKHPRDLSVYAVDGGYLLYEDMADLPLELYAKGGLSYFNEDQFSNTYEVIAYVKLIYNFDFYSNRIRFGFGEGVSYVKDKLEAEVIEATAEDDKTSKFLNYLDITIDFDIGKLTGVKSLENFYFGYLLKHRSGVFGLYNGVHGGSNYNSFYLEKNF